MPQVGIRELKNETLRSSGRSRGAGRVRGHAARAAARSSCRWPKIGGRRAHVRQPGPGECRFLGSDGGAGAEIAANWQSDKTAVELIEEQRR